jgi:hypothetical protein
MEHTTERVDHAKGVKITPQGRFLVNCLCGWHSPDTEVMSRYRADTIYHEHVEDTALAAQYERNASRTADSAPFAQCTICRQPKGNDCAHFVARPEDIRPKNIWA